MEYTAHKTTHETITAIIPKIKLAGIATMSYWSIVMTNEALYFCNFGSALGLGVGTNFFLLATSVIGDVVMTQKTIQKNGNDLQTILTNCKEYFRFSKNELQKIILKKRILGGKVRFPNGKEKTWRQADYVSLKLTPKYYKLLCSFLK